jgi:tyrosyl-tRNA synthetase
MKYNFEDVRAAILSNAVEVLPSNPAQLDVEIKLLVDNANVSGQRIRHYIGFEISGQIHIGTGMMTAITVKKLQDAGIKCTIWLANYHTWLNGKLDGKLETIEKFRSIYFEPVFKKCLEICGCDVEDIDFLDASSQYEKKVNEQTMLTFMLKTSLNLTLARVNKSITITGKKEGDAVNFGLLLYPPLQVTDAFFLQSHIIHAGMDQRKCHVLMREVAGDMDGEFALKIGEVKIKPIAIHHNLLLSLGVNAKEAGGRMNADSKDDGEVETFEEVKMSKSKPDSAVWVTDNYDEISRKFKKAYCPMPSKEKSEEENLIEQKLNPILNWCEFLVYPAGKIITIKELEKFGGKITKYESFAELKSAYVKGVIHPLDLKEGLAQTLSTWFSPIVEYGAANPAGIDLLKSIKKA